MSPYIVPYIPPNLAKALAPHVPHKNMQKLRKIVEEMDQHSRDIFYKKKAALEKGDEAVVQQIGEGRDIMSILSKATSSPKHSILSWTLGSEGKYRGYGRG